MKYQEDAFAICISIGGEYVLYNQANGKIRFRQRRSPNLSGLVLGKE